MQQQQQKTLSQVLLEATQQGISIRFRSNPIFSESLYVEVNKEVEGHGDLGLDQVFSRSVVDLSQEGHDVVSRAIEKAVLAIVDQIKRLQAHKLN